MNFEKMGRFLRRNRPAGE